MEAHGMQRRLAAIMNADVVGYSGLMAADEEGMCVAVTNWSTEAAGIAQLRRSKTLPPVAFDPFGDGRWEDVHRGALSTRAAGVPC